MLNLRNTESNRIGLVTAMVLLFLLPAILPIVTAVDESNASTTSARSSPDFSIKSMEIGGIGSVSDGSDTYFAQGKHIIRVVVENSGSGSGDVQVKLEHRGASNLAFSEVTTINLGTVSGLTTTNSFDIEWDATTGDNQGLRLSTVSPTDTNSGNNYRDIYFDVSNYYNGEVTANTLPSIVPGSSHATLGNSVHLLNATVVNSGVKPVSAVMELSMFEVGNATNTMTYYSNTVTLLPGTLMTPSVSSILSIPFDASSITGLWNSTATVLFNGTSPLAVGVKTLDIRFSNFRGELSSPSDRSLQPGVKTVMTFLVHNTGNQSDSYNINVQESNGLDGNQLEWTNRMTLNGDSTATIPANTTYVLDIDIEIPSDAPLNLPDIVTLTLTSVAAPVGETYVLTGVGRIVVGASFNGTVDLSNSTKFVLPGNEESITANITNTGNGESSFLVSAGLSQPAINWNLEYTEQTNPISPGATSSISIKITPPSIKFPLDLAEFNRAGDTISVWIQVQPVTGGIPATDSALMQIRPILTVDPGLSNEPIVLTEDQVRNTKSGVTITVIDELAIEARDNLASELQETLDTTITVDSISFKADNTGGFSEDKRWTHLLTPQSVVDLDIGDSRSGSLTVSSPSDEYPTAGTLSVAVTATPTLSGGSGDPNLDISPQAITYTLTIVIPSLIDGKISDTTTDIVHPVDVGKNSSVPITFENTGNDLSSFRLRVDDESLPDNWIVEFNGTDNIIDNLSSKPEQYSAPVPGNPNPYGILHYEQLVLNVLTDPLAPANSIEPISIRVEHKMTGELIRTQVVEVEVGQIINGTLSPTNQTVDMGASESPFTLVTLSNAGNAPTDYSLWLDTSQAGEVEFNIELPNSPSIFIAPGYDDTVRIRMNPLPSATSDGFYMATLWVSADNGAINMSANIVANISEDHSLSIDAFSQISVTPGTMEKIDFNVSNSGNLAETINVNATIEGDWGIEGSDTEFTIAIGDFALGHVIVQVPSLGGAESLSKGAVHNLTLTVQDKSSSIGETRTSVVVQLIVEPLFIVESDDWPSQMEFHRQSTRTWEVTITNTGNQDVTVNAVYSINRPGLLNGSSDWVFDSGATTLYLPRNVAVSHSFTVRAANMAPDLSLSADLFMFIAPNDTSIQGNGSFKTELVMSRFFEASDIALRPGISNDAITQGIPYSHIPNGNGTKAAYEVELCGADRLLDIAAMGLIPSEYGWNFTLRVDTLGDITDHNLDMSSSCDDGSQGPSSRYQLPEQESWSSSTFTLMIDTPVSGKILPGDGWDLTFRLYHPSENIAYTVYDEETFTLELDVYSDPKIISIQTDKEEFSEGIETNVTVVVQNVGTATALDVVVDLSCTGLEIVRSPTLLSRPTAQGNNLSLIPIFTPADDRTFTWTVKATPIDWWLQTSETNCVASLNASYMEKNVKANDQMELKQDIVSWSPGVSNSFIATVTCLLISIVLFRLTSQNEKFRLLGVYASVLGLGFSFHLFQFVWWGFVVLALSVVWIWRSSWNSTDEFRLIHEDYQRARQGLSTLYIDHFEALAESRKQLNVILCVPVLGMLAVVLGIPPQLAPGRTNLVVLVLYVALVMTGVLLLIKRADRLYGAIYGRLTDIEVKSTRIERDLGDPARLFNELASDGLNLDEIFAAPEIPPLPPGMESPGMFENEEVNNDA